MLKETLEKINLVKSKKVSIDGFVNWYGDMYYNGGKFWTNLVSEEVEDLLGDLNYQLAHFAPRAVISKKEPWLLDEKRIMALLDKFQNDALMILKKEK